MLGFFTSVFTTYTRSNRRNKEKLVETSRKNKRRGNRRKEHNHE
ncbi:hypothetical protein D932_01234 [Enterococcus casseliflavus 14-MB-W-14]|nr:hypothetical protein D932_01234 [Enterococcus casseliflavus 14-MB-W-14]